MGTQLVLALDQIGRERSNLVGGKCANLGELLRIGAPIPEGFAITGAAYERFLEESRIGDQIKEALIGIEEAHELDNLERASAVVHGLFSQAILSEDLRNAILGGYLALGRKCGAESVAVAVRSSGLAEDGNDSSFAGQFDSFLNVKGEQQLLEKTLQCWASQFTVRAMMYRKKRGLDLGGGPMGIAVIKMVEARTAGVGFSADPVTGDRSRIVLEGSWGLGEAIVQGLVSPDRYVFDKDRLVLIEKTVSDKDMMICYAEQGIQQEPVPDARRRIACLTTAEATRLAELARLIEDRYGRPQDFEWVIDSHLPFPENVFVVQTRPVTVSGVRSEREKAEYLADLMIHMFRQYRGTR
ncbi:MAG: hypothetical protein EPO25_00145 [Gammaproteobacteria bacterium]|nr:MAG: hypothetical protein EPO25_00145 [Gammaproteobacteria bacterium]